MSLDDLAHFISARRPKLVRQILLCFYNDGGSTKAELLAQTGLRPRTLEYYLTKLRRWRILWTQRRRFLPALYHLEPKAFRVRIETLLYDPLDNFAFRARWQPGRAGAMA